LLAIVAAAPEGVILLLSGGKVGVELSAAVSGGNSHARVSAI